MKNNLTTSIKGLNALICGSTSGIGYATANEFVKRGAKVTLFARNQNKLKEIINKFNDLNNQKCDYIVGDFNDPKNIEIELNKHLLKFNKYHILINNSGGPKGGPILEASNSEFLETFNRHLVCNHVISKALIPFMKKDNYGRIINIISTSVKQPIAGLGVSNTIRGAVASWAKTMSFEVAEMGITLNNILPGYIETERLNSIIEFKAKSNNQTKDSIINQMRSQIPAQRFGSAKEIAMAIAFLSSPAAGYINGVSLAVDGGRLTSI
tara:strand:- start:11227 stop:12027 length:801 start_codon:yes stop_codon:yes gene_type:complete